MLHEKRNQTCWDVVLEKIQTGWNLHPCTDWIFGCSRKYFKRRETCKYGRTWGYLLRRHRGKQCRNQLLSKSTEASLADEICGFEFHKPIRKNESEPVSIKETRDASLLSMEENRSIISEMKNLYEAAAVLRRINKCKRWKFRGKLDDINDSQLPKELCCFVWLIVNNNKIEDIIIDFADDKSSKVHKRTVSLAQSTVVDFDRTSSKECEVWSNKGSKRNASATCCWNSHSPGH